MDFLFSHWFNHLGNKEDALVEFERNYTLADITKIVHGKEVDLLHEKYRILLDGQIEILDKLFGMKNNTILLHFMRTENGYKLRYIEKEIKSNSLAFIQYLNKGFEQPVTELTQNVVQMPQEPTEDISNVVDMPKKEEEGEEITIEEENSKTENEQVDKQPTPDKQPVNNPPKSRKVVKEEENVPYNPKKFAVSDEKNNMGLFEVEIKDPNGGKSRFTEFKTKEDAIKYAVKNSS